LMLGIQVCCFGNWNEIAAIVQMKSSTEWESHYIETYLDSPISPLPVQAVLPASNHMPHLGYDTTQESHGRQFVTRKIT
jgi:hypothetical protein